MARAKVGKYDFWQIGPRPGSRRPVRAWDGVAFCYLMLRGMSAMICPQDGAAFLSAVLEHDSRAFKSSAYITICVRDSTGSKQGLGMGQTGTNANGGR